jgi:hypothetical protein
MAEEFDEQHEPVPEVKSPRVRRFLRLFLMVAGGLAAPCLLSGQAPATQSAADPVGPRLQYLCPASRPSGRTL